MTTATPAAQQARHSSLYSATMRSDAWRRRRQRAIKRAGYKCQRCGRADRLECHHLTYDRLGHERPADLIVLCHECHAAEHRTAGPTFGQMMRAIRRRLHDRKRRR